MIFFDIEFIGFFEVIPFLSIIVLLFIGAILTYLSYHKYKSISKIIRFMLIVIRTLLFIISAILLTNPVYKTSNIIERKPEMVVLFDQSLSIGIDKGDWSGTDQIPLVFQQIDAQLSDDYSLRWVGFDYDTYEIDSFDSLIFDGIQSDIGNALFSAFSDYSPESMLLVSDGVVTRGRDPAFVAQGININIHTLALGDSSKFQDVLVSYVDYSAEMITNTDYSVSIGVRNDGFVGSQSEVKLYSDGDLKDSKVIRFENESSIQQLNFNVSSEFEGIQNFEVIVEPIDSEWSIENNKSTFDINFVDNRIDILYLAYQIHPDVSIVKQVLFDYPEVSITEYTWAGTSFVENELPMDSSQFDLIVIHGLPNQSNTQEIYRLRQFISDTNTLLLIVPGIRNTSVYSSLLSSLNGFQSDGNPMNWSQSQIQPVPEQLGHPVLSLQTYNWSRSPLVTVLSSGMISKVGNLSLFYTQQYGDIPVISSQRVGNHRSTVVTFSDFKSFYLSGSEEDRSIFTNMLGNLITWSASDLDKDLVDVTTNKVDYSARESIVFNARVLKEDGSPQTDATINVELRNTENDIRNYSLPHEGNGNYSIALTGLPKGFYSYTGRATINDFEIGSSTGSFSIGNAQQELINTIRQDATLQQISAITGGISSDYTQIDSFLNDLGSLASVTQSEATKVYNLYKQPFWFILLVLLVTAEWIIRRKLLLP